MLSIYKKTDLPPKHQLELILADMLKNPGHYEQATQEILYRVFGENERTAITELCTVLLEYPVVLPVNTVELVHFINYVLEES